MADRREWPDYTDPRLNQQAENMMSYHPLRAEKYQPDRYGTLRDAFIGLSMLVNRMCPNGRAKDQALVKLEEALMRSTQAIAVGEDS